MPDPTTPAPLRPPHHFRGRAVSTALAFAAAVTAAGASAACRAPALGFGATPGAARANADDFFASVAARFTNVLRTPKFAQARPRLAKAALTPSKIYEDTAVWSRSTPDSVRVLDIQGSLAAGRYVLNVLPGKVPRPRQLAESHHRIQLTRLGESEFEWNTSVDFAVGRASAADLAGALGALLRAAEGRSERELRADYRAHFPRATAALGRLFVLDSLKVAQLADGSTASTLRVRIDPERLKKSFPAFAEYVKKYVGPSSYRFVLDDRRGNRWFDASAGDDILTVRVRTLGGRLVTLDGSPRPMPDSLRLTARFFTRILFFDVGVSELHADFLMLRSEHERGWLMRFNQEPRWHFPLAARRLIQAPLRRPFEQGGATLRIAVRDSAGTQTLVQRHARLVVKESAILRWLGALGTVAMNDFAGKSEIEENRFIAEAFWALQADARALTEVGAGVGQ